MSSRWTRKALDALVVGAAMVTLAGVVYTSLPEITDVDVPKTSGGLERETARPGQAADAGRDIARIVSAHLFGVAGEKEKQKQARVPETRLQLRLVGMITSADQRYARALIGVNSRDVNPYKPGDSIEGTDARIGAVEANRVLLNRNGAIESLYLQLPYAPLNNTGASSGQNARSSSRRAAQGDSGTPR